MYSYLLGTLRCEHNTILCRSPGTSARAPRVNKPSRQCGRVRYWLKPCTWTLKRAPGTCVHRFSLSSRAITALFFPAKLMFQSEKHSEIQQIHPRLHIRYTWINTKSFRADTQALVRGHQVWTDGLSTLPLIPLYLFHSAQFQTQTSRLILLQQPPTRDSHGLGPLDKHVASVVVARTVKESSLILPGVSSIIRRHLWRLNCPCTKLVHRRRSSNSSHSTKSGA